MVNSLPVKNVVERVSKHGCLHSSVLLGQSVRSNASLVGSLNLILAPPSSQQGMKKGIRSEMKKTGPLKLATLNGLTVVRMPIPDEGKDEHGKASNDDRVGM